MMSSTIPFFQEAPDCSDNKHDFHDGILACGRRAAEKFSSFCMKLPPSDEAIKKQNEIVTSILDKLLVGEFKKEDLKEYNPVSQWCLYMPSDNPRQLKMGPYYIIETAAKLADVAAIQLLLEHFNQYYWMKREMCQTVNMTTPNRPIWLLPYITNPEYYQYYTGNIEEYCHKALAAVQVFRDILGIEEDLAAEILYIQAFCKHEGKKQFLVKTLSGKLALQSLQHETLVYP